MFFPMVCGRKVGSLKRRRGAMWPDKRWKVARRCGAKQISKSKCKKHTILRPPLEVEMWKKCAPLWREAHFQVKMYKTPQSRTTLGSWDVEKCTPLWRAAHFPGENVKNTTCPNPFWKSDVVLRGRRKGFCTLPKMSKTWGFCCISKNDGKRGTFAEDVQGCMSRGRRGTRDMFIRDVRNWFAEIDCILEHQICRFAKMILRDRCSISHDLASLFRGSSNTLET